MTWPTPSLRSVSLIAGLLLSASILLWSAPSTAGDIQVGGQFRLGIAHLQADEDNGPNDDDDTGFGLGGQIFAVYKFIEEIGVGLNVDISGSFHEVYDNDANASEVGFGLLVRSDLINVLALCLWLDYTSGELEVETAFGNFNIDGDGFELGLAGFYKFEVHPMPIFVEVGPVFTYGTYEADNDNFGDQNLDYFNFMVAVQGTFQIGL